MKELLEETNTKIRSKPNYAVWWHHLVAWFVHALFFFSEKNFRDFWTTLGPYIYAPGEYDLSLDYAIISHELAHRQDDIRYGWKYRLSYIFSRSARRTWELRAYTVQMIARYQQNNPPSETEIRNLAKKISGITYGFAFKEERLVDTLLTILERIRSGQIESLDPDVIEDLHPDLQLQKTA